jgi:hypothetical protein
VRIFDVNLLREFNGGPHLLDFHTKQMFEGFDVVHEIFCQNKLLESIDILAYNNQVININMYPTLPGRNVGHKQERIGR